MATNFVLLEKITVGSAGASSVTFSSIPQTGYTDLVIKASARTSRASDEDGMGLYFNADTSNYTWRTLFGNGSSASSVTQTSGYGATWISRVDGANATSNTFASVDIYIPNYTSSNYKSYSVDGVTENNGTTAYSNLTAPLFSSTAAITSATLVGGNAPFIQYSTFYLYGVAKLGTTPAIQPYATGGDTIMTDGTYWYHAFKSSGTFTPAKGLSCDVLVIAGGGGGGTGGGGAGGLLAFTSQSLIATGYTVTVGGGGTGMDTTGYLGMTNGSNSSFGALTASVGGGAGKSYSTDGNSGGSGGGAAVGATRVGGAGTTSQGNAGGANLTANYSAGGGGGAGAVGQAGQTNKGGNGGVGINTYSSWASVTGTGDSGYFAGGGGGGFDYRFANYSASTGGTGGGGAGNTTTNNGIAGTANTGGGGGAGNVTSGSTYSAGGNGGSGLVIVRYAI